MLFHQKKINTQDRTTFTKEIHYFIEETVISEIYIYVPGILVLGE